MTVIRMTARKVVQMGKRDTHVDDAIADAVEGNIDSAVRKIAGMTPEQCKEFQDKYRRKQNGHVGTVVAMVRR